MCRAYMYDVYVFIELYIHRIILVNVSGIECSEMKDKDVK